MQFILRCGSADGLLWIYSRLGSFECSKGGLFQSFLLALECKVFGSPSLSVTGEFRVSFNLFIARNGSRGRICNHDKKTQCLCIMTNMQLLQKITDVTQSVPNDIKPFLVLPKDLMINQVQNFRVSHVGVFLLIFSAWLCGRKQWTHMCCTGVYKCKK